MATGRGRGVGRGLRTIFQVGAVRELTDGQLLERFACGKGEAAELAFGALVDRHGPMVLRACRATLPDPDDANDAFQATFLVLVEKARGLWVRDSLGPWLHQVAHRTAQRARTSAALRRRHERLAAREERVSHSPPDADLERAVHEEVDRLPGRFRAPVILCDLEGRTHEQAARHLGWPVGTVKSRLNRARERLRGRLRSRGLGPPTMVPFLPPVPASLVDATARVSSQFLTASAGAPLGGAAVALAREVLRGMFIIKSLKVAAALLAVSGVGVVAEREGHFFRPGGAVEARMVIAPPPTAEVVRRQRPVTLRLRGVLDAARFENVHSRLKAPATIASVVPQWTWVKKGDLVCELDSDALRDELARQTIAASQAEAAYQNARLAREVAEIAVTEYLEGTYKQEHEKIHGEIALAESDLKRAEDRVAWAERMKEKSYTSADQLASEKLALKRARFAVEQAQTKRTVLEKFTRDKTVKELQNAVEKARSDERAKQSAWEQELARRQAIRKEIEACRVLAPIDGQVVHGNAPGADGEPPAIEAGATVRPRQLIARVSDSKGPLLVEVKAPEAWVDRITIGRKARVMVDAFAGIVLTGTVQEVAPRPDPTSFFRDQAKVYPTKVGIDLIHPGLNVGMTALVEVPLGATVDALSVPARAVVRFGDKRCVAVKRPDGEVEWREVTLGAADGEAVEVREGLREGETVLLAPGPTDDH